MTSCRRKFLGLVLLLALLISGGAVMAEESSGKKEGASQSGNVKSDPSIKPRVKVYNRMSTKESPKTYDRQKIRDRLPVKRP